MPRRGENIYKRKDGRWEGRMLKPDGKYRYFYAKSYKEVKEREKIFREKPPERKETKQIESAAELFESWLQSDSLSLLKPSTYESYYCCMEKYVLPFFKENENMRITELSTALFLKSIKENGTISESYKRKIITIFKTAMKEILKNSPDCPQILSAIKLPKAETAAVQVFSVKEQRQVENAALEAEDPRALGIVLCFYTGIRLGELCALKWGDIDFEAGTMSIKRTVSRIKNFEVGGNKTQLFVGMPKSQKSVRKIPLPEFLLKIYAQMKVEPENENIFILSGSKTPIDPRTYQKLYKKVLKTAGIKEHKFHAIRHTFATRALELGVDIKTLSEILGHANASITLNIYAHSLMEQKKIAIQKLNEMHIKQMGADPSAVTSFVAAG